MDAEQFAAAESMHHTLSNVPCICAYDHPYAPRGKLLTQCARCKAIAQWERVRPTVAPAAIERVASVDSGPSVLL
jgi:hypothetical protein